MPPTLVSIARFFHRSALLRRIARATARGMTVRQPFHGGVICLDAVDHSWSWLAGRAMEYFDRDLQDRLLDQVRPRGRLIDIGCNVGVMTQSVLLRDSAARAVCVDPNDRAIQLLRRSLQLNRCADRAQPISAAVSAGETKLGYDQGGSFIGRVTTEAPLVNAIALDQLLATHATSPVVIKIDVEGYETRLADALTRTALPAGSVALIELHPEGFNNLGAPRRVLDTLKRNTQLGLRLLDGTALSQLDPGRFQQLEITWPE